jgi:hypothetical protein
MRAVGRILGSYFHRRFFLLALWATTAYLLAIAHAVMRSHPKAAWCFFLYSAALGAAITGLHLRQALEGSEADLLPNYRRAQLLAAGVVLGALVGWPVLLTAVADGPPFHTLSAFLPFVCSALWIAFLSPSARGAAAVLGFPAMLWLFTDIYELAGPSPDKSWTVRFVAQLGPSWPTVALLASVSGLLLFVWRFQAMRCIRVPEGSPGDHVLALQSQDWSGPVANRVAAKAIRKLSRSKPGHRVSRVRLARLFEFAMFSPVYTLKYYGGGILLYCAFTTYLSFHQQHRWGGPSMNYYLPSVYYFFTATLAADFLSHRDRLPIIYLGAQLPSREMFARTAALSYLLVVGRQMLAVTLSAILLHLALPWTTWTRFPQLCVMGLALSVVQVAVSLLAAGRKTSAGGIGWLMINIIAIVPAVLLALWLSIAWTAVAALALIAGFLFWLAMRRWIHTEFDFI